MAPRSLFLRPALSVGLFLLFAVVLVLYMRSETQVHRLKELRFRSFLLADELRQSSDDMTRMFRSYIETADPFYKKSYQDILDIRNGKKPRPEEYWRVYWDLVPRGGEPPRPDSGQTVPLLERMRQTGFSAEEQGKGTGLGLSTVHGIVKQSGAYIWAYSEVGHGTVFNLYFPRCFDTAKLRKASGVEVRNTDGNEHLLLVEDNSELKDLAVRGLCSVGYSVASASNAQETLALLASTPEGFALIISDVVLPDVTGPELVSRAREGGASIPVIFMSGYTGDSQSLKAAMETGDDFLQKPFTIKTLLTTVRQVLDRGPRK